MYIYIHIYTSLYKVSLYKLTCCRSATFLRRATLRVIFKEIDLVTLEKPLYVKVVRHM